MGHQQRATQEWRTERCLLGRPWRRQSAYLSRKVGFRWRRVSSSRGNGTSRPGAAMSDTYAPGAPSHRTPGPAAPAARWPCPSTRTTRPRLCATGRRAWRSSPRASTARAWPCPRSLTCWSATAFPRVSSCRRVCALLRPQEARAYTAAGHELAVHGWIHERNTLLTAGTERELQFRSADTLERIGGVRPVGIRTPSWDFSPHTLAITREMGLLYDSSLMADDEPYELVEHGEATGVVEIPVEWIRDDAPYFMMDRFASLRPYIAPRDVLRIWQDEFAAAYAAAWPVPAHAAPAHHRPPLASRRTGRVARTHR